MNKAVHLFVTLEIQVLVVVSFVVIAIFGG